MVVHGVPPSLGQSISHASSLRRRTFTTWRTCPSAVPSLLPGRPPPTPASSRPPPIPPTAPTSCRTDVLALPRPPPSSGLRRPGSKQAKCLEVGHWCGRGQMGGGGTVPQGRAPRCPVLGKGRFAAPKARQPVREWPGQRSGRKPRPPSRAALSQPKPRAPTPWPPSPLSLAGGGPTPLAGQRCRRSGTPTRTAFGSSCASAPTTGRRGAGSAPGSSGQAPRRMPQSDVPALSSALPPEVECPHLRVHDFCHSWHLPPFVYPLVLTHLCK